MPSSGVNGQHSTGSFSYLADLAIIHNLRNDGPYFLDSGFYPAQSTWRVDSSDPTRTVVRLFMNLNISFVLKDAPSRFNYYEAESKLSMTPQFSLYYSPTDPPQLKSIVPWDFPHFDISLLRAWLKGCEALHGVQCLGSGDCRTTDLPRNFRVIDAQSMKVIKPTSPVRFAALSYMWQQGGDGEHVQLERKNLDGLEIAGGLENLTLPNVISDAISLCRELGEAYFWVDRLCIVQDDAESKHDQVLGMDQIYQSATFTIIAALDDRKGLGLPGFHGRPRKASLWSTPHNFEVEGRGIRPNGVESIVNPSLWNKRGWTFQERVLSRRRVFITENLVMYDCFRGQAYEELTYCPQRPRAADGYYESEQEREVEQQEHRQIPAFFKPPYHDTSINYNMSNKSSMEENFHWIEDYTSRQLSFGTDILDAFIGVGIAFSRVLGSKMIFGLPEKCLPQALMWSCFGSTERRTAMPQIPSWSWASSLRKVSYYWILQRSGFRKDLVKTASLVYFHFQDPDLGLRKLEVSERWIDDDEMVIKDFENRRDVPALAGKYIPGVVRSTKTWQESPHSPWQALAHQILDPEACAVAAGLPGCLIFNSTVASLKLDHESTDTSYEEPTPN